MKRETIVMDEYGRVTVPTNTVNVWISEAELLELFGVIAPTLRAAIKAVYKTECCNLARWKDVLNCPTVTVWTCMPCQWLWHSLSVSVHPMPKGYAMLCWIGCACEKKSNSYGHSCVAVLMNVSLY